MALSDRIMPNVEASDDGVVDVDWSVGGWRVGRAS